MFDLLLIGLAVLLTLNTSEKYRLIASVVTIEFILHYLAYHFLMLDYRTDNGWLIFVIYMAIQLPIMAILQSLKSHFVITALIFINLSYNAITASSYFYAPVFDYYSAYKYVVGAIMLFELIYLGMLANYADNRDIKDNSQSFIDGVFRNRVGDIDRGVV